MEKADVLIFCVLTICVVDSIVSVKSLLTSLRWEDEFERLRIELLEEHVSKGKDIKDYIYNYFSLALFSIITQAKYSRSSTKLCPIDYFYL